MGSAGYGPGYDPLGYNGGYGAGGYNGGAYGGAPRLSPSGMPLLGGGHEGGPSDGGGGMQLPSYPTAPRSPDGYPGAPGGGGAGGFKTYGNSGAVAFGGVGWGSEAGLGPPPPLTPSRTTPSPHRPSFAAYLPLRDDDAPPSPSLAARGGLGAAPGGGAPGRSWVRAPADPAHAALPPFRQPAAAAGLSDAPPLSREVDSPRARGALGGGGGGGAYGHGGAGYSSPSLVSRVSLPAPPSASVGLQPGGPGLRSHTGAGLLTATASPRNTGSGLAAPLAGRASADLNSTLGRARAAGLPPAVARCGVREGGKREAARR
jgi:hypothetical protein